MNDGGDVTPGGSRRVGDVLADALAHLGVTRVFGAPSDGITGISGLSHVRVDEPVLAATLATAAGRVGPAPGAALLPGRRLLIGATPGLRSAPLIVRDGSELLSLVAAWDRPEVTGSPGAVVEAVLDLDLDAPADELDLVELGHGGAAMTLAGDMRGVGAVIVAGPGVAREGRVDALVDLARSGGMRIVVVPSAAGMVPTGEPWFGGVVTLQADDLTLAGVLDAPFVVLSGVDAVELDRGPDDPPWSLGSQVLEVEPVHLATLGLRWEGPGPQVTSASALMGVADDVEAASVAGESSPVAACRALGALARRNTLLAADAGPAGLWLARVRTDATAGTLRLPGLRAPGFAAAAAIAAALDARPSVAVVTDGADPLTAELLALAVAWQVDLTVVSWGDGTPPPGGVDDQTAAWTAALRAAGREPGVSEVGLGVDLSATRLVVEAFGPVEGWRPGSPVGD